MTMEELSNVQGRAWEDVDVRNARQLIGIPLRIVLALITLAISLIYTAHAKTDNSAKWADCHMLYSAELK